MSWAAVADVVPLYPLYALLFADTGLSIAQISALFAIWSTVAILAEVPSGALADRFSRRAAVVAAGLLQAGGYVLWIALPGFPGFAAGFVLWGLGGALSSGALEALVYDGLAAVGATEHYARVNGRINATGLLVQIPAGVAASSLFALGGFMLAGWVSIGCCLAAAALATRFPEAPRAPDPDDDDEGYLATLRAGIAEAAGAPAVRAAVLAVAVLGGVDAVEEFFPLLAGDRDVPTEWVPVALLVIPLAGAAGAALGGSATRLSPSGLAVVLGVSGLAFGATAIVRTPVALVAVAVFYGLYRLVLVVIEAGLQDRIEGSARATVTSVAGFGIEVAGLAVFVLWAVGEVVLVAALVLVVAALLPVALRVRARNAE